MSRQQQQQQLQHSKTPRLKLDYPFLCAQCNRYVTPEEHGYAYGIVSTNNNTQRDGMHLTCYDESRRTPAVSRSTTASVPPVPTATPEVANHIDVPRSRFLPSQPHHPFPPTAFVPTRPTPFHTAGGRTPSSW